ncbi:MAG: hypothetical protein HDT22_02040 [Ruminococcus sp.]|nr:hypothetical protein [Ruminococcus sp.]
MTIFFIDSISIRVCDNHRTYRHGVFSKYAKIRKNSMGWFYDFKLHLVINDEKEILSFFLITVF